MIELTERLLNDAGGWQAMKAARALHGARRVMEAAWEEPWLRGRVREGETEYRAGLRIGSRTDIENLCTCRASRREGMVCAHSLAVGLEHLRPHPRGAGGADTAQPGDAGLANMADGKVRAEREIVFCAADGMPLELSVILPPQWQNSLDRGNVTVSIEACAQNPKNPQNRRCPLAGLAAGMAYRCDPRDLRLLEEVLGQTGGQLPAALSLTRESFTGLLTVLKGHPRITLGRAYAAIVEADPMRLRLAAIPAEGGGLRLQVQIPAEAKLLTGTEATWLFRPPATFSPVAPELPAAYRGLFRDDVAIPAAGLRGFLDREAPILCRHFEFSPPNSVEPLAEAGLDQGAEAPTFALKIEGSLNHLAAELIAHAKDRVTTITSRGYVPRHPAEAEALRRLGACGFVGSDPRGEWILKGEQSILRFFSRDLQILQKAWKTVIGPRFEHVTNDIDRLESHLNVRGSGENWFELNVDFATVGGDRLSAHDLRRLLRSGQNSVRLKNQRRVVFHSGLLDEFEQVLLDCSPEQRQPGLYRFDRRDAPYVSSLSETAGVQFTGETEAVTWCPEPGAPQRLLPVELGPLEGVLREYQKQGVAWLTFLAKNRMGGILADEMGLGKTLQSLAYLDRLDGRALVVCPSSLVLNWQREADRFTPGLRAAAIRGVDRATQLREAADSRLWITSYTLLRRDLEIYRGIEFAAIILDEAQHIKNPDSQAAQAVFALRSARRFALTGTPVENSVRDIWSLMNFLMPGYLGARRDFRERFEAPIAAQPGGPEHQRLIRRLRPFLLRRTKREVAKELPDKIIQTVYCEMNTEQVSIYRNILTGAQSLLADLASSRGAGPSRLAAFTMLLRLRQACLDTRLLGLEGHQPREVAGKLDLLSELVSDALDDGHRILVFSQFSTMLRLIRARLTEDGVACCHLDGATRDRQAEIDHFQAEAAPVFLISLKAGGTGLNLTAADTVIHFDPWWNPAVEAQATDRAHRIGQKRVVTVYKLIARGTVEEKLLALQQRKRELIDLTVESEEPMMTGLSADDLRELLAGG